ncbi:MULTISPECIES: LysR family transcriptional regulator [Campylobacter]|uniref:LysR family transcriptional regulator n=1 Tax=Campylobacter TaxID=194 RepID=UPI001EF09491|nr:MULTISPECIES: LysR family transcriptional regulator [unclassified Campylobacter]MCR8678438.1 LysR family transcriptional regulator [Campylobacter sp. RM19072]MEE3704208.1 LysR family transcriptional regulator [Campylobacter sp. CX2-8023-23]MEE3776114.1 LysR family transcriptional regulator [Campylobacter sp. CX2-4080-23]
MIDFNKIYTFMTIVKERSFSKASTTLGLSQPAVTLQIKKLEEALQTTLLVRRKNGIVLTKEGDRFYKLCMKFEGAMFRFKEEAHRIKDEKFKISVATNLLIAHAILPFMLDKICDVINSDLDVKIADTNNDLVSSLIDKRCDIIMTQERLYNEQLIFKKLFEYDIILVSNMVANQKITPAKLGEFNFITDRTKSFLKGYFEQFGVNYEELRTIYRLDGAVATKYAMLNNKAKEYVAFLPRFLIRQAIADGLLFPIDIEGVKIIRPVFIAGLRENEHILDKVSKISINL